MHHIHNKYSGHYYYKVYQGDMISMTVSIGKLPMQKKTAGRVLMERGLVNTMHKLLKIIDKKVIIK